MGNSFSLRGIIDLYGDAFDGRSLPGGKDEEFEFGFVAGGQKAEAREAIQRVGSVAGLGVGEVHPGVEAEPEVGEAVGEGVALRHTFGGYVAAADNQGSGVVLYGGEEFGEVVGIVLEVGVDGDAVGVAEGAGLTEAGSERCTFAPVALVGDDSKVVGGSLEGGKDLRGGVGAAVIDDYNIAAVLQDFTEERSEGSGIIVCRHQNAYFQTFRFHLVRFVFELCLSVKPDASLKFIAFMLH